MARAFKPPNGIATVDASLGNPKKGHIQPTPSHKLAGRVGSAAAMGVGHGTDVAVPELLVVFVHRELQCAVPRLGSTTRLAVWHMVFACTLAGCLPPPRVTPPGAEVFCSDGTRALWMPPVHCQSTALCVQNPNTDALETLGTLLSAWACLLSVQLTNAALAVAATRARKHARGVNGRGQHSSARAATTWGRSAVAGNCRRAGRAGAASCLALHDDSLADDVNPVRFVLVRVRDEEVSAVAHLTARTRGASGALRRCPRTDASAPSSAVSAASKQPRHPGHRTGTVSPAPGSCFLCV